MVDLGELGCIIPRAVRRLIFISFLLPVLGGCEGLGGLLSGAPKPDARVVAVRFAGLTLDSVELDLDVEVDNPYSVDLPILRVDAALSSGGGPIVETRLEPDAPIPAQGARTVEVPVKIRFADVVAAVSGVKLGDTTPYQVDLVFGLDAPALGPVDIPVRHRGDLWLPSPPSVEVARVELTEASLTKVRAEIELAIDSDNAVTLPLRRFDYGLRLAGVEVAQTSAAPGTEVPANGRAQLVVPIDANPLQAGQALLTALTSQRVDYALAGGLELETPLGLWSLPVDVSGRAPIDSSD